MSITTAAILKIGSEAAQALNGAIKLLPNREQRKLDEFFKFMDKYNEEITRDDSDTHDLLAWRERKQLLVETIIKKITKPS